MKRSPLRRKRPLRAARPLERGQQPSLHRRQRMKPVNAGRRRLRFLAAYESEARVRWYSRQPCIACGATPCDMAHIVSRAAGGGPNDCVSLCRACHRASHSMGIRTFELRSGVDLKATAAWMAQRWSEVAAPVRRPYSDAETRR